MKRYFKYIMMALAAVVFIGTFVFLYIKSQPKPVEYNEFEPKQMDIRKTTVVTGKIEPRNEVNVKPQISGIITEILKEAGQKVEAGEVIAKVKVIPDMSSLSAAQARVRLAGINERQARTDFEREKALFDKGLVSADEYDKIAQALRQAREEAKAVPAGKPVRRKTEAAPRRLRSGVPSQPGAPSPAPASTGPRRLQAAVAAAAPSPPGKRAARPEAA